MNIAVLGANGRSGRAFVAAALAAGHVVRAGVHSDNPFRSTPSLTVVECDATKVDDLRRLIKGTDAVVSLIGHSRGSSATVQTVAMHELVPLMEARGPKRLVSLTGTGVRCPGDKVTLLDRLLNFGLGIFDPARLRDGQQHVRVIEQSSLEWTVIRVLKLQGTEPQAFVLREHGPTKPYVSRDEVAEAILDVLEQHSFIRQAPIITN